MVTKCLNARPKTKELGINVCLMFIEIEKQDVVIVSHSIDHESCDCHVTSFTGGSDEGFTE